MQSGCFEENRGRAFKTGSGGLGRRSLETRLALVMQYFGSKAGRIRPAGSRKFAQGPLRNTVLAIALLAWLPISGGVASASVTSDFHRCIGKDDVKILTD
jgi:hypothetical protein